MMGAADVNVFCLPEIKAGKKKTIGTSHNDFAGVPLKYSRSVWTDIGTKLQFSRRMRKDWFVQNSSKCCPFPISNQTIERY